MLVAVSGYYGYGNLGDEAVLAGLLGQLRQIGAEPLVLSGNPELTTALHGVEAVHRYRGLVPALRRSHALVSGGGGLLQDGSSSRSLRYYLGVIRLARLLRLTTVVYGQSIGPLSPTGLRATGRVLRNVPVAVRDLISIELLRGAGVQAELVADPALLLSEPPAGSHDVLLVPRAPYREFSQALLAAGQEAMAMGQSVGVLAIQPEEDAAETGYLLAGLPGATAVEAGTWQQAYAACAGAGLVLSVRLHGLVFAAAASRSHAGLVYDPKVQGFLDRSGGSVFTTPVDTMGLLALVHEPPPVDPELLSGLRASAVAGGDWLARQLQQVRG